MQVRKKDSPTVSSVGLSTRQQGVFDNASRVARPATDGLLRGVDQATARIDRDAQEEYDRESALAVMNADTALSDFDYQMSYDPESGYLNKKGSSALGQSNKLIEDYEKKVAEIGANLSPDQKLAFDRMSQSRFQRFRRKVAGHEQHQLEVYRNASQKAAFESAMRNAIADPYSDDEYNAATARIKAYHGANPQGLPSESISLSIEKDISRLTAQRIARIVDDNPIGARNMLDAQKDRLLPGDLDRLSKMVERGALDQDALNTADKIILESDDYGSQVSAARQIKDADLRDAVLSRIDRNRQRRDRIAREDQDNTDESALAIIENGGAFEDIPISTRLKLSKQKQDMLKEYEKHKNGNGQLDEVDQALYYDKIMTDYQIDKKSILNVSPLEITSKLEGKERDKLLELRRGIIAKDPTPPSVSQLNQYVELALKERVINKNQKPHFRIAMEKELDRISQDRDLSFDDLETVYNKMATQHVFNPDGFFNTTRKYGFELDGTENPADVVVPDEEREKILESWARTRGSYEGLTEEIIKSLYIQKSGLK